MPDPVITETRKAVSLQQAAEAAQTFAPSVAATQLSEALGFRESRMLEARFPRTPLLGSSMNRE